MKVTVSDCLGLEVFTPSILAAGRSGLSNRVRTVSVLDAPDADAAAAENGVKEQLVLTSFSGVRSDDEKARIVTALGGAGVAGIVVFHLKGEAPAVPRKILSAADEAGLPLVLMPENNSAEYVDVLQQVIDKVFYGDNFRNGLINNTIYHLLDFERHSSFQSALKEAALNNEFQRDHQTGRDHRTGNGHVEIYTGAGRPGRIYQGSAPLK